MSRHRALKYLASLALVGLVYVLRTRIEGWVGLGTSPLLYLPAVTLAAWYGGLGPGLLATMVGSCVWIYHDIPPLGSLYIPPGERSVPGRGVCRRESPHECLDGAAPRLESRGRPERQRRRTLPGRLEPERGQAPGDPRQFLDPDLDEGRRGTPISWSTGPSRPWFAAVGGEVVGKTDTDLFLPPIAGPLSANDRAVLDLGRAVEAEETLDLDDGPHTFLSVKFPMHDDEGAIFAIGGISTDITDLKHAQRRAVQAERLAAIGQMVTGLAHESRNALQRSQACLEMLKFRFEANPESLDLVTGIQDAQDDLQRLYEEVRTYAAPLVIDRREASLRLIVRESWSQLEWTLRGRDARLVELAAGDLPALVDVPRMVQVFRNLLDNALAACHDPVVVTVGWSRVEQDGRSCVRDRATR